MAKEYRPLLPVNPEGLDDVVASLLSLPENPNGGGQGDFNHGAVKITNPESYLILPGKKYGKYSYPNTLISLETMHKGKNWFDAHKALHAEGAYMPTIRQFVEFLKILKSGKAINGKGETIKKNVIDKVLDDILKVRDPWRGRWLDADFKVSGGNLNINYGHILDAKGKITGYAYSEPLNCLREDKKPGINLEDWLNRATEHGLPPVDVKNGDIWYWAPLSDNNSVAWFGAVSGRADLYCGGYPAVVDEQLGVHAARKILV